MTNAAGVRNREFFDAQCRTEFKTPDGLGLQAIRAERPWCVYLLQSSDGCSSDVGIATDDGDFAHPRRRLTVRVRNGSGPTEDVSMACDPVNGLGDGTDGWCFGTYAPALRPTLLEWEGFGTLPSGVRITETGARAVVARM